MIKFSKKVNKINRLGCFILPKGNTSFSSSFHPNPSQHSLSAHSVGVFIFYCSSVRNYCKLGGLRQHKFLLKLYWLVWRAGLIPSVHRAAFLFWNLWRTIWDWPFFFFLFLEAMHLHPLTHGFLPALKTSNIISLWPFVRSHTSLRPQLEKILRY